MKKYVAGTNDGKYWQVGGEPDTSDINFNTLKLEISSPAQTFWINRLPAGVDPNGHCFYVDYQKTIELSAGATVKLSVNPGDGMELMNIDPNGKPIIIPGVTNPHQPYNGQIVLLDVVSLTEHH